MPNGGGGGATLTPLTYFSYGGVPNNTNLTAGADKVFVTGFFLPVPLRFSNIVIIVATTDGANNYDAGVYTQAGALIANIGAQTLGSGGYQTIPALQGAQTIQPGLYCFAFTGTSTNAHLGADRATLTWVTNDQAANSTGGSLPATIPAQVIAPNNVCLSLMLA